MPAPVFDDVMQHLLRACAPRAVLVLGAPLTAAQARFLHAAAPQALRLGLGDEVADGPAAAPTAPDAGSGSGWHQRWSPADPRWREALLGRTVDLVWAPQGLGHLPHGAGQDLLHALLPRCAWLALCLAHPLHRMAAGAGQPASWPLSIWNERSIAWHDLYAWDELGDRVFVLLRGLQPAGPSLQDWCDQLHADAVPLRDAAGAEPVRPARLRLVQHPREVELRPG